MSRRKKSSSWILDLAATRAAGLESIDSALDLGGGVTVAAYKAAIAESQSKLNLYNQLLSQSDEAQNTFLAAEATVRDLSERVLAGVAGRYGKNSDQYEMAGGTRKSDRKKVVRRSKQPIAAA